MISPKHQDNEILIVGQGLAGTLLSYFLIKNNQPVKVLDQPMQGATSTIAAGIINPITGRRMVKSWRFEALTSHARKTYLEIGCSLGISFFHEKNILRALPNVFEENEWDRRSGFEENQPYFCKEFDLEDYKSCITPARAWGELTGSAKVNLPLLTASFRQYLQTNHLLIESIFDYSALEFDDEKAIYKDIPYKKIVFCEGAKATENPYFNYLPFSTSKGEMLLVRIKGLNSLKMLKNKIYLVPLEKELFWVGSSNSFNFEGDNPTEEMLLYLRKELEEVLTIPFEILSHQAGIRPTVTDKRPLLGLHPELPNLGIFNGLGTKGASLGPLFAEQMALHLTCGSLLDEAVDIKRFN